MQYSSIMHRLLLMRTALRSGGVGDAGRLLAFAGTVLVAAASPDGRAFEALALAGLLAILLSPEALKRVARDRILPPLAVVSVGIGAMVGHSDLSLGPLALSSQGLFLGLQMMARALAILLAVYTLTTRLSISTMSDLFERIGFRGMGFALGVAVNALPLAQRNFQDVMTALRLRGGFRRRWWRALKLLLLTTIVNSVNHAGEIVAAAESRAFSVEGRRLNPIVWKVDDSLLLLFLIAAALAILLR